MWVSGQSDQIKLYIFFLVNAVEEHIEILCMVVLRVKRELQSFSSKSVVRGCPGGSAGHLFCKSIPASGQESWLSSWRMKKHQQVTLTASCWHLVWIRQAGQRWLLSSANFEGWVTFLLHVAHAPNSSLCEHISLLHTFGRYMDSGRGSHCQLLFCFKKRGSSIYYRYILKGGNKLQLWVMVVFFYSVITIIIFHSSKNWLFGWAVWETLKFRQQD